MFLGSWVDVGMAADVQTNQVVEPYLWLDLPAYRAWAQPGALA